MKKTGLNYIRIVVAVDRIESLFINPRTKPNMFYATWIDFNEIS
jgi:hypothetical protein